MSKILECGDVFAGCEAVVRGGTVDEMMPTIVEHAGSVHGLAEIDAATAEAVGAAIRDE
jgi:predicted small metal-binding protein